MFFKVKRKETVPESVCRIARKCIDAALDSCREEELEAIHTTRKEIKKLRALLRLVRSQAGKKQVEPILGSLREAAGYLAMPRDAHVRAQALETLLGRRKRKGSAERLSATRAQLQRDCHEEAARFRQHRRGHEVRQILKGIRGKVKKLELKSDGWNAIAPGLKKNYQRAQTGLQCSNREASAEKFHEWRKRVKDLLYNVNLLEPLWPEQMCALGADLDRLGELLGDDHDLHMLRQTAIKRSVNVDFEAESAELFALIDPRQDELRIDALKLGNRIFREKPSDFCDRLHAYWKMWKSKGRKHRRDVASMRSRSNGAYANVV